MAPAAEAILVAQPGVRRQQVPLAGALVLLALVLVLSDIALRRLSP